MILGDCAGMLKNVGVRVAPLFVTSSDDMAWWSGQRTADWKSLLL